MRRRVATTEPSTRSALHPAPRWLAGPPPDAGLGAVQAALGPPVAVATLAEGLRVPLSSLAAASERLLHIHDGEHLDPNDVRERLRAIRDQTSWLQNLVENLLCAAAIQAGRLALHPVPLNLLDVVMAVQPIVTPLLQPRGQALKLAATQHLPEVAADQRRIGQALVNLIAHASDSSSAHTSIMVRLTPRGSVVRVTVAHRGPGLLRGGPAQALDVWSRELAATATDPTGLGLAIGQAVVAAHNGRVGAENRPKGGACLWFELPTAESR